MYAPRRNVRRINARAQTTANARRRARDTMTLVE
jgi:hypothetical protein